MPNLTALICGYLLEDRHRCNVYPAAAGLRSHIRRGSWPHLTVGLFGHQRKVRVKKFASKENTSSYSCLHVLSWSESGLLTDRPKVHVLRGMAGQVSPSNLAVTPNTTNLSTIGIAPSGDVVLVIGDEEQKMRVHSLILRTSSKVFEAMLGPSYSEGANLSSAAPKDISLPEDDAAALEIIFNVIHCRTDAIDDPLDPSLVLRVAIMADKYDFIEALKYAARDWMKCDAVRDAENLWRLAIASCWLRDDRGFENNTLALLCQYGGSYVNLGEVDRTPPDVVDQLAGTSRLLASTPWLAY